MHKHPSQLESKNSIKLDYRENVSLANVFKERKGSLIDKMEMRDQMNRKRYVETENEDFSFSKTNNSDKFKKYHKYDLSHTVNLLFNTLSQDIRIIHSHQDNLKKVNKKLNKRSYKR